MDAATIQANPSGAFDLAQFEAKDWATLTVLNPKTLEPLIGADGKPVEIDMYGPASEQYLRIETQIERDRNTALIQKVTKAGKTSDGDDELQRAIRTKKLIACTREIRNFPVAPEDLFKNPRLGYIANQAAQFMEVWGHFLPEPSAG
jgi:hypothetical protein